MMNELTINELRRIGIDKLNHYISCDEDLFITNHGKNKYVLMDVEHYYSLKESELELAYLRCMEEVKNDEIFKDSIEEHMERLDKELKKHGIEPR